VTPDDGYSPKVQFVQHETVFNFSLKRRKVELFLCLLNRIKPRVRWRTPQMQTYNYFLQSHLSLAFDIIYNVAAVLKEEVEF
jgi:hypothetical protein